MTVFGDAQLERLHVRDLKGLSYLLPNVAMDEVGTTKSVANFSFRGQGVNSSIPSIDPTVGVFVDGIYQGINTGVVVDQFDLESVEVLRGPQGVLFGRNVTGGAVLINTKDPSAEFEGTYKVALESGDNRYLMVRFSGPLVPERLLGKLALYHNHDGGSLDNQFDGNAHGAMETSIVRAGLTYLADSGADFTLKYDRGVSMGDGAASRNRALFEPGSFDFSIDEAGYFDNTWHLLSARYTADVGIGTLINIAGWRKINSVDGRRYRRHTSLRISHRGAYLGRTVQ